MGREVEGNEMAESRESHEGPTIRLGISTCLLGERVRYDGGHKLDRFLVNTLGQYVDLLTQIAPPRYRPGTP
jgi:hypothetical protein